MWRAQVLGCPQLADGDSLTRSPRYDQGHFSVVTESEYERLVPPLSGGSQGNFTSPVG